MNIAIPSGLKPANKLPSSAYAWAVVGVFWCVYFLNQADRQVIFSVFPLLQREMNLSNTELGLLGSGFQWVYAVVVPVAGGFADVMSRRNLIALAILVWSLATFCSGLAGGFVALLALRALTGAGEAFYYPAAASVISDYHGKTTRALAISVHQTSVYAGIVFSGTLAGYIGQHYGWRVAFLSFGFVGFLVTALVRSLVREPVRGASDHSADVAETLPLRTRLVEVFGNRTVLLLMAAFLCMNFVNVACLTWMPTLLYQKFRLTLAQAGFHATLYHHLGAFAGVLLGGRLADRWTSRLALARPIVQLTGLALGAPFVFALGWSNSTALVFTALGLFGFFRGLYDSNLFATLFEVIRPEARATATGSMLAVAFLGGGSSALAVGWFSERIGLGPALASTSVFYVVSAVIMAAVCVFSFRPDMARMRARFNVS
jgi:predicted MFS family arabinose efflux permease